MMESGSGMSTAQKKNYIAIMRAKLEKQIEAKKEAKESEQKEGRQEAEEARMSAMMSKKEQRSREPIESPWYPQKF